MSTPTSPIPVAVLGATGTVGRRIVERMVRHPWFDLVEVAASERSTGRALGEAWHDPDALPTEVRTLPLRAPAGPFTAPLILSALPRAAAATIEPALVAEGRLVVSNASAGRMDPATPLVIPEVNPDHLELLGPAGTPVAGVVTNPNCAVIPMTMALAPLHEAFGVQAVVATTFQAVSGAGLPGPGSITMIDNLHPWIPGEEEKIAVEPNKLLGTVGEGRIQPAEMVIGVTSTRVPVLHGHLVDLSIRLRDTPSLDAVRARIRSWPGRAAELALPSLPPQPLRLADRPDRPQPRLDRDDAGGMGVTVGRIRECPVNGVRMAVMAHNLERGAAGAAVANAELVVRTGRVPHAGGQG